MYQILDLISVTLSLLYHLGLVPLKEESFFFFLNESQLLLGNRKCVLLRESQNIEIPGFVFFCGLANAG